MEPKIIIEREGEKGGINYKSKCKTRLPVIPHLVQLLYRRSDNNMAD
jgi:hypothetical protein